MRFVKEKKFVKRILPLDKSHFITGDIPFKGVDISYKQFDLKKVERDTGYVNQVPFAKGIAMTAEYIRNGER